MAPPPAVLTAFGVTAPAAAAIPVSVGHIHETWLVPVRDDADGQWLVLQRLNGGVFDDLDAVVANVTTVTTHLRRRAADASGPQTGRPREVLTPVPTRDGAPVARAGGGEVWRATRRIVDAHHRDAPADTAQAAAAGRAFGRFVADLADLDPTRLHVTIAGFHDLPTRRRQLADALARDRAGRAASCGELAATVLELAAHLDGERTAAGIDDLPTRVVHNDAKVGNLLFDDTTGTPVAVIDLDTVMPGRIMDDLGELVRTGAATAAEDESDPNRVDVDEDLAIALGRGFASAVAGIATESELATLAWGPPSMAVENALRFATDHLEGDRYFRIARPDHNLARARAQLALAQRLLVSRPRLARDVLA